MFFDTYSEMLNDTIDGLKREDIQKLFDLIEETRNNGKHLFVLGNGGSAAAASHWVCDFGKGINRGDSKFFHRQITGQFSALLVMTVDMKQRLLSR